MNSNWPSSFAPVMPLGWVSPMRNPHHRQPEAARDSSGSQVVVNEIPPTILDLLFSRIPRTGFPKSPRYAAKGPSQQSWQIVDGLGGRTRLLPSAVGGGDAREMLQPMGRSEWCPSAGNCVVLESKVRDVNVAFEFK